MAIGFVFISFELTDFYLIPWNYWEAALTARANKAKGIPLLRTSPSSWWAAGKSSIRKDELSEEWLVNAGDATALDYLTTVSKLWR